MYGMARSASTLPQEFLPSINDKPTDSLRKRKLTKQPTLQDECLQSKKLNLLLPKPVSSPHLSFSLPEARAHLSQVDPRFSFLFDSFPCRPFEPPKGSLDAKLPNPFQSLSCSILGQQVSTLAARSITYRFIKLFYSDLPEKLNSSVPISTQPFPKPEQVLELSVEQLRTAGLSQRKAEYIRDLAQRFSDGRLADDKLMSMDADTVMAELCAVRGIGPWTAQMFLIFTAKHPDILPCADLAIQKGLLRWYISDPLNQSPKKSKKEKIKLTPETNKEASLAWANLPAPPIPSNCSLSLSEMKKRLEKPLKPGVYLTPLEMEQLSTPWRPYRSIPVCFLWSMTDVAPDY
ncbi:hypothetical protein O181_015896 [Austropuccinia psidii MF-1]|uniref:HhH-GPD domain-containing protein n=1 Tax=Austropuccinia psidii MF-1 TaxID=1389203 RepID=A0A9Q3C4L2_9BASI|nr:hypothetical protein [Austropuccinia psidii MF-1]